MDTRNGILVFETLADLQSWEIEMSEMFDIEITSCCFDQDWYEPWKYTLGIEYTCNLK